MFEDKELPRDFVAFANSLAYDALYAQRPRDRDRARRDLIRFAATRAWGEQSPVVWQAVHSLLLMAAGQIPAPLLLPNGSPVRKRNETLKKTLTFDLRLSVLSDFIEACPTPKLRYCMLEQALEIPRPDWSALAAFFRNHASKVSNQLLRRYAKQHPTELERQWAENLAYTREERERKLREIDQRQAQKAFRKKVPTFFLAPKQLPHEEAATPDPNC